MRQEQSWGQWHRVVLCNPELATACSSSRTAAWFSHLPPWKGTGKNKNRQFAFPPQTSSWVNPGFSTHETIFQCLKAKFPGIFVTTLTLIISATPKCIKKRVGRKKRAKILIVAISGWQDCGWFFFLVDTECVCVCRVWASFTYAGGTLVSRSTLPQRFTWTCPWHKSCAFQELCLPH